MAKMYAYFQIPGAGKPSEDDFEGFSDVEEIGDRIIDISENVGVDPEKIEARVYQGDPDPNRTPDFLVFFDDGELAIDDMPSSSVEAANLPDYFQSLDFLTRAALCAQKGNIEDAAENLLAATQSDDFEDAIHSLNQANENAWNNTISSIRAESEEEEEDDYYQPTAVEPIDLEDGPEESSEGGDKAESNVAALFGQTTAKSDMSFIADLILNDGISGKMVSNPDDESKFVFETLSIGTDKDEIQNVLDENREEILRAAEAEDMKEEIEEEEDRYVIYLHFR